MNLTPASLNVSGFAPMHLWQIAPNLQTLTGQSAGNKNSLPSPKRKIQQRIGTQKVLMSR
jgi:hypothetical protein